MLDAIEKFQKPEFVRTDNEANFNSRLMKFSLWFLGIKKQTTDNHSPWHKIAGAILNSFSWPRRGELHGCSEYYGRIERFFGMLKSVIKTLPASFRTEDEMPYLMHNFQFWYNNVRMHQNLDYQTPEQIYCQQLKYHNLRQ